MNYAECREHLVEWVRSQLTGAVSEAGRRFGIQPPGRHVDPEDHHEALHGITPVERFPTGVLYPVCREATGLDPASEANDPDLDDDDDDDEFRFANQDDERKKSVEPTIRRRRYTPPSAVGFSFFVRGGRIALQVLCSAVRYELKTRAASSDFARDEKGRFAVNEWRRIPIADVDGQREMFSPPDPRGGASKRMSPGAHADGRIPARERVDVLENRAGLEALWRPFDDGWIVTVSFFNKYKMPLEDDPGTMARRRNENSLFEASLRCLVESGEVGSYPHADKSLLTEEEQDLELRYRHRHIYAVGHGAAVNWRQDGGKEGEGKGAVRELWTDFFPAVEVPQVTAEVAGGGGKALQLARLAALDTTDAGGRDITPSSGLAVDVGSPDSAALAAPSGNPVFDDLEAFVAGYAQWLEGQKSWAASLPEDGRGPAGRIVGRIEVAVARMRRGIGLLRKDGRARQAFALANQAILDQMRQAGLGRQKTRPLAEYRWRPFQLAFLLCDIESVVNEDSEFRDTLDLIWFPTGGGKTEAYLGLIAFLIVWRRLTSPASGGGTTALMRYTLRLLTAQQYLRATRMICALELIRRRTPALGTEPITVGMWVGAAATPNTLAAARKVIDKAAGRDGKAPLELILSGCPWCGQSFRAPDNYIVSPGDFHFRCTNAGCAFGRSEAGTIPCDVVDEVLYSRPPTLLIATIDKFARLAWEERANAFFGGHSNRPPELVIQDELHLIAGALGSVAGLYEAALDAVLIQRGIHPKYIASTATIRNAEGQARRLYGRQAAIFPPPGLSCDDSYFARTVPLGERPGRLYVGYLAPMLGRQTVGKVPANIVPLAAAILLAPEVLFSSREDRESLLDAWWTQVVYHGSLKGVGNTHNAFSNDVRERLRRYWGEYREFIKKTADEGPDIEPRSPRVAQLTSLSTAEENARTFSLLERPQGDPECLDAALATNMISVGLDVPRLAVMIVNGQPLTTAEYIQAGSRVGRGDVPGIVFVNYYRDQTRSHSHYENFRPYHESFYRFVEATSATPYTYQARLRALHAALVIAIRHSCPRLLANHQAGSFDPEGDHAARTIAILKNRCRQADEERAAATAAHIDRLVEEWRTEVEACREAKRRLNYQTPDGDRVAERLLYNHNDKIRGRWATLQSMRNVEKSALMAPY